MNWRGALALLAAAELCACASLPVGSDGLGLDQRRAALDSVGTWEMHGRLAVDTGDGGFQGSFNWRQQDDALELAVRGPLRNGVLQVAGRPDALTVTARGETRTLTDPEAELSALLGWWLPVASLPHWLLGFPDRGFGASHGAGHRWHAGMSRATTLARRLSGLPTSRRLNRRTDRGSARAAAHRSDARQPRAQAHDRRLATRRAPHSAP